MNVIALVDDIEVRIGRFQAAVILGHAHAGRRNAIARQRVARGVAAGVVTVRHAPDAPVVRRIAICGRDALPGDTFRGESRPSRAATDLLARQAPTRLDRPDFHP